jgi:hypothetical protein
MTARALVRQRKEDLSMNEITAANIRKVTRFRPDGEDLLEKEVKRLESLVIADPVEQETEEVAVEEVDAGRDVSRWATEPVKEFKKMRREAREKKNAKKEDFEDEDD